MSSNDTTSITNRIKIEILELKDNNHFRYSVCEKKVVNSSEEVDTNPGIGIFSNILDAAGGEYSSDESVNAAKKCIWIVVHPIGEFLSGQRMQNNNELPFAQELLIGEMEKIPIIHLATTDLFVGSLYGRGSLPSLVPRYYQIMDSSIWNYLVPLINSTTIDFDNKDTSWQTKLYNAIDSIYKNYEKGLYRLKVAQEYADLNARLVNQSYLVGSHASGVSPFIFHSEDATKRLIKKEFLVGDVPTVNRIKDRKWRILLVDDKASAPMDIKGEEIVPRLSWNSKLIVIKGLLEKRFALWNKIYIRKYNEHEDDYVFLGLRREDCVEGDCNFFLSLQPTHETRRSFQFLLDGSNGFKLTFEGEWPSEFKAVLQDLIMGCLNEELKDTSIKIADNGYVDISAKNQFSINSLRLCEKELNSLACVFYNRFMKIDYSSCRYKEKFAEILHDKYKEYVFKEDDYFRNDTPCMIIEYSETLSEAKDAMKNKTFDIILLDYLLKGETNREYGYELLDKIYSQVSSKKQIEDICAKRSKKEKSAQDLWSLFLTDASYEELRGYVKEDRKLSSLLCEKKRCAEENLEILVKGIDKKIGAGDLYKIGPKGRLFFMFISAYSSAVHDRLLAEGLNQSEDYWFISLGACPTNTPQLFLYNLIKLMEKRLDDSHIKDLSPKGIIDIVEKIYFSSDESPRKFASKYYQVVQSLQYHYRNILDDIDVSARNKSVFKTSGSVLMTDFMNNHINLGGLLEHLAQLVHLTAFGTIRQWPEMWEEYIYFKAQLGAQLDKEKDKDLIKRFDNLCVSIQDYISDLKSSSL